MLNDEAYTGHVRLYDGRIERRECVEAQTANSTVSGPYMNLHVVWNLLQRIDSPDLCHQGGP